MVEVQAIEPGEEQTTATRIAGNNGAEAVSPVAQTTDPKKNQLYLQLGSFISRDNAESLRARLTLNNVSDATVLASTVDRKNIYRVRIGPLASVEEADKLAVQIDRLGIGVPTIVID